MRNVLTPTVQELLVTTCCPLGGFVPERLMATKSIRDWYNCLFSLRDVRARELDDTCISVLNAAIQASAFPDLQEVCPISSNLGWFVELTFKFRNKYDGTFFCNLVKGSIKSIIVTVRCALNNWLPSICESLSIADLQSSLDYLRSISTSAVDKSLLEKAKRVLSLATAFSAETDLKEWCCVETGNKGIVDFSFRFSNPADMLGFIPMIRRILPIAESAKT